MTIEKIAKLFWNQVERRAETKGLILKGESRKVEIRSTIRTGVIKAVQGWYVRTYVRFPGYWQSDLEILAFSDLDAALAYAASLGATTKAGYLK